ncbi:MAG: hypothetical protein MZW92_32475 [Comamonadaceae bacterium]|nr:hypothetical protein [Comamonadaceae bacterium]
MKAAETVIHLRREQPAQDEEHGARRTSGGWCEPVRAGAAGAGSGGSEAQRLPRRR